MSEAPLFSSPILLFFIFLFLSPQPFFVISQSSYSEQEILLNIKNQWGNPPSLQSWDATTSPCQWSGIQCASEGTVTGFSIANQNIAGEILPSICDLKNLTTLDLAYNYLGGEFPTFLYNCTQLRSLNLSQNLFGGQLPNDINNLSPDLQHLDLSANNFTGDIPSSIGQLKGLITLHLEANLFNGAFPSELWNLGNLEELCLAYNPFPPMKLPTEFGKLKSITFLWMTRCHLIGKIPESFNNLHSLVTLDLGINYLEDEIPSGLFLLKNLAFLQLYNNTLSGKIPISIEAQNLKQIDLSHNSLTGTIPQGMASLQKLEVLNLFSNQFHGILPPSIGLIPRLKTLKLWSNRFPGPLPPELGLHSRLEDFQVSDNEFTGQLPENLCSSGTLLGLVASNNRLNGSIPESLGQCSTLRAIELYNNSFSGEIPEGLCTLRNLSVLVLGNNYFSGEIPKRLWRLDRISVIRLGNNQFSGQFPGRLAWNMTWLEINNNRFSGAIPRSVGTCQRLLKLEASNNLLSGTIPLELTSLWRLNSLSLDGNNLSGRLPSKIISWTNLNSLNLSRNKLSGSIPSVLGSLPDLIYLDLSNNQFLGQIPPEIGLLRLIALNLSFNKLTGGIPFGYDNAAYQTSFLGTGLCSKSGVSDLPKCSIHQDLPVQYLALIIVLGLVGFLAIVYFSLLKIFKFRKRKHTQCLSSWEITSFHRLDFTEEDILANLIEANLIGYGGSGKVYRIPMNVPGGAVAAKRIWNRKTRNEKEFLAEVQVLGTIRHLNIVKLLCCISSEDSKILVYEYMDNQSLDKWIHEGKQRPISALGESVHLMALDWPVRLRIAIGAAKGLSYMHHDCSPLIIHRDVKSSNILLDSECNAKIADFGLSKILAKSGREPHTVSVVAGTFGYIAPEYCHSTKVNEKIDVYSFGVVLLELVTGKEAHNNGDEYLNLAQWAWRHYSQGHPIADAFDNEVTEDCYLEEMTNVFMLGLMCTTTSASSRPSMKEVLQVLQR